MQPLSYQIHPTSCWVTSMLNGLLLLHGSKNRVSKLVYRLLHSLLTDEGVYTQGRYFTDLNAVLHAVQSRTGLMVRHYDRDEVEDEIRKLTFRKQVAVCLVNSGQHAILLTGRRDVWIEAFDPDWDGVKRKREVPNAYITQPEFKSQRKRAHINVLIHESHLVRVRGRKRGDYLMGTVSSRTLTVIEKA